MSINRKIHPKTLGRGNSHPLSQRLAVGSSKILCESLGAFIGVIWISLSCSATLIASPYDQSMVIIQVSSQKTSLESPWEKTQVKKRHFLGTVLSHNRILVAALALVDAKLIEMRKVGSSRLFKMKVGFIDRESDLAVLESENPRDFQNLRPIALGDNIRKGTKASLLSISKKSRIVAERTVLADVGVYQSSSSRMRLLNYLFKVQAQKRGLWEPIVSGGRLVGLASGRNDDYTYAIPISVIKHFLADSLDGSYRGFPGIGVIGQRLNDGYLRQILTEGNASGGVRVRKVLKLSPFYNVLRKDDVVVAVQGRPIDNEGSVSHPLWGKIEYQSVISSLYAGDMVKVTYVRKGKEGTVTRKSPRFNSNAYRVPYFSRAEGIPHIIVGGLVIQELTYRYFTAWGKNWRGNTPSRLAHVLQYENESVVEGSERVIMLNRVLADKYNRGYANYSDVRISKINELEVSSMSDVKRALARPIQVGNKLFTKFSLLGGYGSIILGYEEIPEANKRVAESYGIVSPSSFFQI